MFFLMSDVTPTTTDISFAFQMMSNTKCEGYGFKPHPVKYYHNDAGSVEEKKSVRLYIQPLPPTTAHASTLSWLVSTIYHYYITGNVKVS